MTDRDLIALITREIAPNPWFRRDRLVGLNRLRELSASDFNAIRTSENKAERIAKAMREAGAVR